MTRQLKNINSSKIPAFLLVMGLLGCGWLQAADNFGNAPRERTLIDTGWRFRIGDPADLANPSETNVAYYPEISNLAKLQSGDCIGPTSETNLMRLRPDPIATHLGENVSCVQTNFNDGSWRLLDLPHDWVPELPFNSGGDKGHGYKAGIKGTTSSNTVAWYRRTFTLPASYTNKTLSLDFDGVYRNSLVWLNGHIVGRNVSGYSSLSFDVSPYANPGGTNVLVVRVDASRFEGWFYEGAGIYRHVWLVKTDPVHIAHWGTWIANRISGSNGIVTIQTQVNNDDPNPASCTLASIIYDSASNAVVTATTNLVVPAGTNRIVAQTVTITNARLWSLDFPNLYRLTSVVTQGSVTNDSCQTSFGVRTFTWDANNGLLLNGKRVEAKGVCNHQDFEGVGLAMPDRIQYFRVERLKALGFNAIRTSHNAPTPEMLDACDQLGMLVMDENRRIGFDPETLGQLQRGVLRDRNHASVFMWSLGNEETLQGDTTYGVPIMQAMQNLAHQLDPTRLCTVAMHGGWGSGFSTVIDVQGGNYHTSGFTSYHSSHPTQPLITTEEGSQVGDRGNYTNLNSYVTAYDIFNSGVGWSETEEAMWQYHSSVSFVAGFFNWTGFDYRGEPTPTSWPSISSHFGILDMCGFPKDCAYYFQANWLYQPVLHLFPHWNWAGREGQPINLWCYSSCETVELFLNGVSQGSQMVDVQSHVEWNVPYTAGTLQAVGYVKGRPVITNIVATTGSASRIVLEPDRSTIVADGRDVSLVTVSVVDSQGRVVPTANNAVTFTVTGGKLIGLGNGDANDHESDTATNNIGVRSVFNGFAQVIVQSSNQGNIFLTATASGLTSANVTIVASNLLQSPAAPTGCAALSGDRQVTLGWDVVPGAITYNLKRATVSGGPYTLIAGNTATAGSVDTNVVNGTTYYYVITALNPAGESVNSVEVSAVPAAPLYFITQPSSVINSNVVYTGTPITFSALATNSLPVSYQWYQVFAGVTNLLAGETNASYVHPAQGNETAPRNFFVVAANANGSITSFQAVLSLSNIVAGTPGNPVSLQLALTNYSGYSGQFLSATDIAGVYAVSNWNVWPITPGTNTTQPGVTLNGLKDWHGAATSMSMFIANVSDGWHQSQSITKSDTANARLMNTFWKVNPTKSTPSASVMYLTISNVPNAAYDAYLYLMQNSSGAKGSVSAAGLPNYYFTEFTAFNSSSNLVTTVDTTGLANPLVNYIKLPGVSTGGTNSIKMAVVYATGGDGISVCGMQLVPVLTSPSGVSAIATNNQVVLGWNAVFGATSYTVLRATSSGGPYSVIAGNLSGTGYTDNTATNGTTYYYVISAVNGSGQSVNSTERVITPGGSLAITLQPASVTNIARMYAGVPFTFTVAATGNPAPVFQWHQVVGGTNTIIAGATNVSFMHLAQTGDTNGSQYFVVVSNSSGSITSAFANLYLPHVLPGSPGAISLQLALTNYTGYSGFFLSPTDTAGAYAVSNWNVWAITPGTNTTQAGVNFNWPVDYGGVMTPVSAGIANVSDGWHQSQAVTAADPANARLMNTFWKVNPAKSLPSTNILSITFTNLPDGTYSAYVYLMQNRSGAAGYLYGGGVTNYFSEWTAFNSSSNFVTAINTNGTSNPLVNYLKLTGLSTGNTGSIRLTVVYTGGGDGIGVSAVQLVPPVNLGGYFDGDDPYTLSFPAPSGHSYTVEVSSNLSDWTPVLTNTAADGWFIFDDTDPPESRRFYRVEEDDTP